MLFAMLFSGKCTTNTLCASDLFFFNFHYLYWPVFNPFLFGLNLLQPLLAMLFLS